MTSDSSKPRLNGTAGAIVPGAAVRSAEERAPGNKAKTVFRGTLPAPARRKSADLPVSILLATPSYGDTFCGEYVRSVMQLGRWAGSRKIKLATAFFDYADIAATRNILLSLFWYRHTEATHLLFMDDDMGLPPGLVEEALALNVDLCGAFYPKRALDVARLHAAGDEPLPRALAQASGFVGTPAKPRVARGRFVTATYIGTGFMLLSRAGLARLLEARPGLRARERYRGVLTDWEHPDFLTPFDRMTVKGREYSEDYAFCRRWRDAGMEIWAAEDADITHTGSYRYRAKLSDL